MDSTESNKKGITAFNAIFIERLSKLVKDIKKCRKDPNQQAKFKRCLAEAKALKQSIKESSKHKHKHNVTIPYEINEEGNLIISTSTITFSMGIKIIDVVSINLTDDQKTLSINFTIKQQ